VIAADLRKQIEDGRLEGGALVPRTPELATAHRVSIATSHRAIALLLVEGSINVSRGRRAVVARRPSLAEPDQAFRTDKSA
jgi:DNA-binding GntR family transcriptional regulator